MNKEKNKIKHIKKRHKKIRAKIIGTAERPRLSVFRSNKNIYAQAVNDKKGFTIAAVDDKKILKKEKKTETAKITGEEFAKKLKEAKIKEVVFDRGGYKYHGRVKALAEGIRSGGIKF